MFICNKNFSGTTISVEVKIDQVTDNTASEIVLYYDPENKWNLNVGLTAYNQFAILHYSNGINLLKSYRTALAQNSWHTQYPLTGKSF